MRLVCDTNVIFSALIAGGKTRELILGDRTLLYAPEFFFTELDAHRDDLREKSKLSDGELSLLIEVLFGDTKVVPQEEFDDELQTASQIIGATDPDDVPFLALALISTRISGVTTLTSTNKPRLLPGKPTNSWTSSKDKYRW